MRINTIVSKVKDLNRCDWYVIFWCIYQLQEILYSPGIINQAIQALIMGWALLEAGAYIIPQKNNPLLLKNTTLLLLLFTIYGVIFILSDCDFYSTPSFYLKSFFNSFLPVFLFYKYSIDGYLDENRLRIYFFLFMFVVILQFFHTENKIIETLRNKGSDSTEITNNISYFFLSLLPMIFFLYKNRLLQYSSFGIIMLFILMSMKRGAIAIASICAIWFLWDSIKHSTSVKHKYLTICLGTFFILVSIGTVGYMLSTSDYFHERIQDTQEGKSSGRDKLYSTITDYIINDDSYIHLVLGNGAYKTVQLLHKPAHNDWLETACNNGLIGIICLIIYYYSFYYTAKKGKKMLQDEIKTAFMMLFFVSFSKTLFSMSLQDMPIYPSMLMAFLTYKVHLAEKKSIKYVCNNEPSIRDTSL